MGDLCCDEHVNLTFDICIVSLTHGRQFVFCVDRKYLEQKAVHYKVKT